MMKDSRRGRIWTITGLFAFALTAGAFSNRALARRAARASLEDDLRDAAASPVPPATAGLAGRPVPTSWFKASAQRRIEMDSALLSSRRRRTLARGQ
jgi:hypothetical protein